ncbi:MAG: DUF1353 domain-containing protein [Gemmatimonadota bacterium]|nr:MAG: DUF1353 domain-containing protein [Gemmatimonadota bacterium]
MSRFTDALVVTPLADGKTWIVLRDFGYDVGAEGSEDRIDVAIGFQTDFASIPRVFWAVLPRWGRYGNAAVIHDWLYWCQDRSRREADRIFLEGMGVLSVGYFTRWVIYLAVRWFGWIAWIRNRADQSAGFDRVLPALQLKAMARSQRPGALRQLARYALQRILR